MALVQTSQALSSNSTDDWEQLQQNRGFPHPSTWTGLVDLDKEEFNSIADNESSELSGEHVVIHLRPIERPVSQETHVSKASPVLEHNRGSSREESDEREVTEEPRLSTEPTMTTSFLFTETQTSNSMIYNFVDSIIRPWKHWKSNAETEAPSMVSSILKETSEEVQTARVKPEGELRGTKGSIDNAILEPESMPTKLSTLYSEEGLLEQEKEVVLSVPRESPSKFYTESSVTQLPAYRSKNTLQFITVRLAYVVLSLVA